MKIDAFTSLKNIQMDERVKLSGDNVISGKQSAFGRFFSILFGERQEQNKSVYNQFKSALQEKFGEAGVKVLTDMKPTSTTKLTRRHIEQVMGKISDIEGIKGREAMSLGDDYKGLTLAGKVRKVFESLPGGGKSLRDFDHIHADPLAIIGNANAQGLIRLSKKSLDTLERLETKQQVSEQDKQALFKDAKWENLYRQTVNRTATGSCGGTANTVVELYLGKERARQLDLVTKSAKFSKATMESQDIQTKVADIGGTTVTQRGSGNKKLNLEQLQKDMTTPVIEPGKGRLFNIDFSGLHSLTVMVDSAKKVHIIQGFTLEGDANFDRDVTEGKTKPMGYTSGDWLDPANKERQCMDMDTFIKDLDEKGMTGAKDSIVLNPVNLPDRNQAAAMNCDSFATTFIDVDMTDVDKNIARFVIDGFNQKVTEGVYPTNFVYLKEGS